MPPTTIQEIKDILKEVAELQRESREELKESREQFKESREQFKESREQFKESRKEINDLSEQLDKSKALIDASNKRLDELQSLFTTQWGKLMESLVEGDLIRLLNERNIQVHDLYRRREGRKNGINYELDIVAHNGGEIVIVEVKTTLRVKHVKKFIALLKNIRDMLPEYKSYKVYGAVAYLRAEEESETFAARQGLLVIRATGDSAAITNDKDFKPLAF